MAAPFVIVGAGAIGGTLGAHLIRAGHPVMLVDSNQPHVEAINRNGLRIDGHASFTVPARAITPDRLESGIRRALIAVKARHSADALELVAPRLAEDGFVVAMQNGLGAFDVADRIGPARTVAASFTFGGYYTAPGEIFFSSPASFRIGNLDGSSDARLEDLRQAFSALQPVEVTGNISGYVWAKLVLGAVYFVTALVDADVGEQLGSPEAQSLFAAAASEVADTAAAEGVRLETVDGFKAWAFAGGGNREGIAASWRAQCDYWTGHLQQRTGIWRDLAVHKRKTEAEGLLGPVVARARRRGVPTPVLGRLLEIYQQVEAGRAELGWHLHEALREQSERTRA